jgi:hypothetical protein
MPGKKAWMPATSAGMTSKLMGIVQVTDRGAAIYEKANGQIQQRRNRPHQDRRGFPAVAGQAGAPRGQCGAALMESQDESIYRLTNEQVDEVRRRRADKNAPKLTLDEFKERLSRRLGE